MQASTSAQTRSLCALSQACCCASRSSTTATATATASRAAACALWAGAASTAPCRSARASATTCDSALRHASPGSGPQSHSLAMHSAVQQTTRATATSAGLEHLSQLQGSPCPESGFCGVEVCGSWSKGAEDMGQRCTRARHSPIGPGAPSADSSAPGSSAAQSGSTTSTPGFGTAGEVGSAAAGRWRLRASVVAATVASILGAVAL